MLPTKAERKREMEKKSNAGVLKFFGIVMILFAIIYAVVGTLAIAGFAEGILPGHETQEIIIIVLAYAVAVLSLICGIACVKGSFGVCRAFGLLFAVVGLVSLIYMQVTQSSFNLFDCIAMVLGVAIYYLARQEQ